jgi:hypothetical protein
MPRDPADLPWQWMVHFYGRAVEIPGLLSGIERDNPHLAIERLARVLEHQDGVIQSTPFAVFHMCSSVATTTGNEKLENVISLIYGSAKFQLSYRRESGVLPSLAELIDEQRLWPEFTGDREDDILWEKWEPPESEHFGWAAATRRIIELSCLSLLHVSDRPMMRARNLSLPPGFAEQRR